MTENAFFEEIFFEQTFAPIALYKIEENVNERGADAIRYIDVNNAYERVNKISRKDVIGKTFRQVWPSVEPRWSEVILRCVVMNCAVHCEGESSVTGKYLEAIALPLSSSKVATIFLDRTELKKSEDQLKEKQMELLEYRSRLRELATKLTISEEATRREIARDLHDSVGHSLLSLLLDLRRLKENCLSPKESEEILERSIAVAERTISESRQLIFELSPPILLEVGITPALEALADNLLSPRGIRWNVSARGDSKEFSADDSVCIILYRMSRELLVNVIKHAKATSVHISVNRGPNKIQVVVEDNGVGMKKTFNPGHANKSGLGLFSIYERLLYIGGDFQIVPNKSGTTVSLLAPLKLKDDSEKKKGELCP